MWVGLLLVGGGFVHAETSAPPFPGQLVDLGGRRLHVNCIGSGSPTVVIESGGGSFSVEWTSVQRQVAKYTRICAYDRAGYAWSDRGPTVDSIEQIIDDLNLLLRRLRIQPPYILVGASLGAIYTRAYQRRFPENVAGLVFVDGTHDEGITFIKDGKPVPISLLSGAELPPAYDEYVRLAPKPKAGPADAPPLDLLPEELRTARQWAFEKLIAEVGLLPKGLDAAESWRQEFTALRLDRLARSHPLGALPLIVLERTEGSNDVWHGQQEQLATLSSNGKLIRAERSEHMIHLYRPDLVAEAILDVVSRSRKGKFTVPP
jgi:pimeloyl-ACP methyl ester carboxylesterase